MKLIIAEKPALGADIARAIGGFSQSSNRRYLTNKKDCVITWAIGHLVELYHPTSNIMSNLPIIPTDDDWQLRIINNSGYKEQFDTIQNLVNDSNITEVINACDAGREGELIFRLIYAKIGSNKPTYRMWINSMTKDGLIQSFKNMLPSEKYEGLNKAAWSRSKSDWIVGLNGTIATSLVMSKQTGDDYRVAIGRVKTPVVFLVVKKQREIDEFIPQQFWEISGTFSTSNGEYRGKWLNYEEYTTRKSQKSSIDKKVDDTDGDSDADNEKNSILKFNNKADADAIIKACKVSKITKFIDNKTSKTIRPPHLFDLGSLQTLASKQLKLSPSKTLEIVQELYEKLKAVTYPRTESDCLPEDYHAECAKVFDALYSSQPIELNTHSKAGKERIDVVGKHIFDNSKISDHFAIIPTNNIPIINEMNANQKAVYLMIVRRFKEAFLPPVEYEQTDRFTFIGDHAFRTTGKVVTNKGWHSLGEELDTYSKKTKSKAKSSNDDTLPICSDFSEIEVKKITLDTRQTTPPTPYTQGTLLNAMKNISRQLKGDQKEALKKCGIGTPATRSSIINGLLGESNIQNALLQEDSKTKALSPTDAGKQVIQFLEDNGIHALTDPEFTADWEIKLDGIRYDASKEADFMGHTVKVATDFVSKLSRVYNELPTLKLKGTGCPKCGHGLVFEGSRLTCEKSQCDFYINRSICKVKLSNSDLQVLIENGETGVIDGFVKRPEKSTDKPKIFSAALKLVKEEEKYIVKFFFPTRTYKEKCPCCNGELEENINGIICKDKDCGIMFWAVRFKKRLSPKQQNDLIKNGKTDTIAGFISKSGANFSAKLVLDKQARSVNLEFDSNKFSNEAIMTKHKCAKEGCNGLYEKNGLKYTCKVCESWFFSRPKHSKPFNEAQIKRLVKGNNVIHAVGKTDLNDKIVGEIDYEFFLDRRGRLCSKIKS